jgi:hypothetical protein
VTAHEILKGALALIDTPDKWTRKFYHANEVDDPTTLRLSVERFSLMSAIARARRDMCGDHENGAQAELEVIQAIHREMPIGLRAKTPLVTLAVVSFGDGSTHQECVLMLQKAIEATAPKPKFFDVTITDTLVDPYFGKYVTIQRVQCSSVDAAKVCAIIRHIPPAKIKDREFDVKESQ